MKVNMKLRYYLLFGAAAFILVGSFFLPNAVAGVTDLRRLDNLLMIDTESISFDATPELSLKARIALAGNSNAEVVPLSTGNIMDFDAASEMALRELDIFFNFSVFRYDLSGYSVEDGSAALIVDMMDPAVSIIVWELTLADSTGSAVTVTIDDETGVILRLVHRLRNRENFPAETETFGTTSGEFRTAALWLAEMMTEYYGLPVLLGDYLFNVNFAYYRADISDGRGAAVPMYGVIRATSFTMNERV